MIKKIFPDLIKDFYKFIRTKPHTGIPKYNLYADQVYPKGTNLQKHFLMTVQKQFKDLNFTKSTKVSSLGTCFAEEFSKFLVNYGGSYIYKEKNTFSSSANWGRVFTISHLAQTIQYSLGDKIPLIVEKCNKGFFDPTRETECGFFNSSNEAKEKILEHRNISKEIFKKSEIIVITLGQNENWIDRKKNIVWGNMPPTDIYNDNKERFFVENTTIEKNIKSLGESLELIKKNNSNVKFILTVSPVPAFATFTGSNVINKSFLNKCIIRYSLNEVLERSKELEVYYYPSFEMCLCDNPKSYQFDNRHIKKEVVNNIFNIFKTIIKK